MIGAAIEILRIVERYGRGRCVHVSTSLRIVMTGAMARGSLMKRAMTAPTDQYRFPADYSTTIGTVRLSGFGSPLAKS